MNENPTERFSNDGFERRVLAEFAAVRAAQVEIRKDIAGIDTSLSTLEDRVDARLKETRPIWEAVQSDIKRLDTKFDNIIRDLYDVRTDIRLHEK